LGNSLLFIHSTFFFFEPSLYNQILVVFSIFI
jgi:hypothetical protein